ncbi:hypothetical protein L198_05139 [Cryptococcus wingfieldii CBS 7118]|uniref:PIN domain-containing protein n=1 Tax=Cryptococcus wingfieldii CBS 7118 TaxID=1295528 RepID=A0A1E3J074_9TREE|nr:hypothetical protein L198_05139 [Cryptococcus wingfieldii CBS 7118]ODN94283.1 hypothetical protein L198_05139 [Cryptococcus wingfieldii CBS 7118]
MNTPPSSFHHGHSPSQQEMSIQHNDDEEMIWEPIISSRAQICYLGLDTNILIKHLNILRTLHAILAALEPQEVLILVPSKVIQEIDGLKHSTALPDIHSPVDVGTLARTANNWLLETHRARREGQRSALRCQSLKERRSRGVVGQNADDEILDCCLYFEEMGGKVALWTNDKNLGVKAEINHVPTIGGQHISLSTILSATGVNFPKELWEQVHELEGHPQSANSVVDGDVHMGAESIQYVCVHTPPPPFSLPISTAPKYFQDLPPIFLPGSSEVQHVHTSPQPAGGVHNYPLLHGGVQEYIAGGNEEGMAIDEMLTTDPIYSTASLGSTSSSTSPPPSTVPNRYTNPPPPAGPRPSKLMLTSLRLALLPSTLALLSNPTYAPHLKVSSPPPTTLPTDKILTTLFDAFSTLDKYCLSKGFEMDDPTRLQLIQATSSVKVVQNYVACHEMGLGGVRRVKTGDMVYALGELKRIMKGLGVGWKGDLEDVLDDFEGYE